MNLYVLLRRLLPETLADITFMLLCSLAMILIYMYWPAATNIFAYMLL